MVDATYNPEVFETPDEDQAKAIILNPTPTLSVEARWEVETPYLAGLLADALELQPGQLVIDYGCGIGRLSKALIEKCDVRVLGVDISTRMRGLAPGYVGSPMFSVVSRSILAMLVEHGLKADSAIAVWVLQHCPTPEGDIRLLQSALRPAAPVGIVNSAHRCIPTKEVVWARDRVDLDAVLDGRLTRVSEQSLDPKIGAEVVAESWFRVYRT